MTTLDTRLDRILRSRGHTQASLARALNTSPGVVNKWARGLCDPSLETVRKAARVLGCTLDELVGEVADG